MHKVHKNDINLYIYYLISSQTENGNGGGSERVGTQIADNIMEKPTVYGLILLQLK